MDYREAALRAFGELNAKTTDELIVEYVVGGQNAPGHPSVEMLVKSRLMKETLETTKALEEATHKVHAEVALLADSSSKLETLTKRLAPRASANPRRSAGCRACGSCDVKC